MYLKMYLSGRRPEYLRVPSVSMRPGIMLRLSLLMVMVNHEKSRSDGQLELSMLWKTFANMDRRGKGDLGFFSTLLSPSSLGFAASFQYTLTWPV